MMRSDRSPSPALRWGGALLVGTALAAAAAVALDSLLASLLAAGGGDLAAALHQAPVASTVIVAGPLVAALVAALLAGGGAAPEVAPAERVAVQAGRAAIEKPVVAAPAPAPTDAALQLLGLLQQEGRFVDFLQEELGPYSDQQIGSAVRSIHEGCRTALKDRLELAPVLPGAEGTTVTVERGFDPAAVRVTGNVHGQPPYKGVLRHPGWRSSGLKLPERTAKSDVSILAPAEVEVA